MLLRSNTLLATLAVSLLAGCGNSSSGGDRADNGNGNGTGGSQSSGSQGGTGDSAAGGSDAGGVIGAGGTKDAASGGRAGAGGDRTASGGRIGQAGGGAGVDGGTKTTTACSFTSPPPAAWSDADAGTTSESIARAQWLHELDALIGQYLRGDVLVYRGTVKANDNTSAVYAAAGQSKPDQSIAQGAALARLEYRPSTSSDYAPPLTAPAGDVAMLVVHGLAESKHIVFSQAKTDPSQTEASTIGASGEYIILHTSCAGCAPSFWSRPNTIAFDLTTTGTQTVFQGIAGQGGHDVDVALKMTASTNLTLAPPCNIQFEDLAVLDTIIGPNEGAADFGLQSFRRAGDEMVFHASGSINGGATTGRCFLTTPYSIDLFVNLNDLADYGVRNFSPGMQTQQCAP